MSDREWLRGTIIPRGGFPPRSQRTPAAPAPNLSTFGFTSVRCACCGANICGTKHTCSRCHRVVDEACMQLVERLVQCFLCTCRACGNELPSHTVECHACHFRVHPTCTTDGVCTWCAAREPASPDLIPKPRKFSHAWQLTRPWLRYDPVCAHVVRGVPCPSTARELRAFRARNFQLQIVHC